MVIKSKIYDYLKKYLDEYLYGFQKDQLEVALLSGNINLVNVNFKPNKVNSLFEKAGLPFHLKAGLIGKLSFKYHYTSWSTNPVELEVDELLLVLGPVINKRNPAADPLLHSPGPEIKFPKTLFKLPPEPASDDSPPPKPPLHSANRQPVNRPGMKRSLSKVSTVPEEENIPELPPAEKGVIEQYFHKIVKNLTVKVRTVIVRYEDDIYGYQHPFAFGFSIDSLEIHSVKSPPQKTVKECTLNNAFVYAISLSSMLVPTTLWEDTLHSQIGIFEAIAAYEIRELILEEVQAMDPNNLLVSPVNAKFGLDLADNGYKVTAMSDPIRIKVSSAMAEIHRHFEEYFGNSQLWWFIKRYRPRCNIPLQGQRLKPSRRKTIIQQWFRYTLKFFRAKKQLVEFIKQKKKQEEKILRKREHKKLKAVSENRPIARSNSSFSQAHVHKPVSILSSSPRRMAPGKRKLNLQDYLKRNPPAGIPVKKPVSDKAFPAFFRNSEYRLSTPDFTITFADGESMTEMTFHISQPGICVKVDREELNFSIDLDTIKAFNDSQEVLTINRPALHCSGIYRPGEIKSNEEDPTFNMYELNLQLSRVQLKYSNTVLSNVLVLYEAFKLDREFKLNMDRKMLEILRLKKNFHFKSCRSEKVQLRKQSLLTMITDNLSQWFAHFKEWASDTDLKLKLINFDWKLETQGFNVEFLGASVVHEFAMPPGILSIKKTERRNEFECWGITMKSADSLLEILEYFSLLNNLFSERIKSMKNLLLSLKSD